MSSPTQPVTPHIGYQAPGPFNLNVGDVQPPVPLYVRKDEILRIQINSSTTGATVTVGFRMMMSDGQVIDSSIDIVTIGTRGAQVKAISMEEGYLLSVIVSTSSTTMKRGQTFVQVTQGRGNTSGIITATALLIQDYVGTGFAACWPGGNVRGSTEGPGWLEGSVQQGAPAAGADFIVTVPTNATWRILGMLVQFTASGTVANRQIQIQIAGNVDVAPTAAVTAGQSPIFIISQSGVAYTGAQGEIYMPMPGGIVLAPAQTIRSNTLNIQVGDQWGNPKTLVEEWITT